MPVMAHAVVGRVMVVVGLGARTEAGRQTELTKDRHIECGKPIVYCRGLILWGSEIDNEKSNEVETDYLTTV